jgi:hypothetical protein
MSLAKYLGLILIAYIIPRAVIAFSFQKGRAYFKDPPIDKEKERLQRERPNNLALAGFSLTALALFLALGTNPQDPSKNVDVKDTTYYLSISLVCFIVAAYLYPFQIRRYYYYTADSLEQIGLLSVGIAMLVFFVNNYQGMLEMHAVYWVLFVAIILITIKDNLLYYENFK